MLTSLEKVCLKNGARAELFMLEAPEDSPWREALKNFYLHKSDGTRRAISGALDGRYAGVCVDRFFFAVVDGEIAGALWYGYGRHPLAAANFGHVYTLPGCRGLGIARHLLRHFKADFTRSGAAAAFCTCSREWIAAMYREIGFFDVVPGTGRGQLMLSNLEKVNSFAAYGPLCFGKGTGLSVAAGTMAYRHEADCAGRFSGRFRKRTFLSNAVPDYRQSVFNAEEGAGELLILRDDAGGFRGWSFTAPLAPGLCCLDFSFYEPAAPGETELFVRHSVGVAPREGRLLTGIFDGEDLLRESLRACGFASCGKLPGVELFLR